MGRPVGRSAMIDEKHERRALFAVREVVGVSEITKVPLAEPVYICAIQTEIYKVCARTVSRHYFPSPSAGGGAWGETAKGPTTKFPYGMAPSATRQFVFGRTSVIAQINRTERRFGCSSGCAMCA